MIGVTLKVDIKRVDSSSGEFLGINIYLDGRPYEKIKYAGIESDATMDDIEKCIQIYHSPFYLQADQLELLNALYYLYKFEHIQGWAFI